jgi:hypothetical protein
MERDRIVKTAEGGQEDDGCPIGTGSKRNIADGHIASDSFTRDHQSLLRGTAG